MKYLLNAGSGFKGSPVPPEFAAYVERRLDSNPEVDPDYCCSIINLPLLKETFDAVLCSHVLEHLGAHEVPLALREFLRVLVVGGQVLIKVPDLQSIGGKLALDQADVPLYQSGYGPITPLDMIYGHQASVALGNEFMRHKTGFTRRILYLALKRVGFEQVSVERGELELIGRAVRGGPYASSECDIDHGQRRAHADQDVVAEAEPVGRPVQGTVAQEGA